MLFCVCVFCVHFLVLKMDCSILNGLNVELCTLSPLCSMCGMC